MLTSAQFGAKIGQPASRVRQLCILGRIRGAVKLGRDWLIPESAKVKAVPLGRPPTKR